MADTTDHTYHGKKAVIIGGGVIGASWAILFLANKLKVTICDPDPGIEGKVLEAFGTTASSMKGLGYEIDDITTRLTFTSSVADAVADADIVQECGPERADVKQGLWKAVEDAAPAGALLLSSSSGIPASTQNQTMHEPGRLIIGHPFNPPHLMPLVEVVPTVKTDPTLTEAAMAFYRSIGKVPIKLHKEVPGFVANRLQSAIFQECVHLVTQGVVTLDELDQIVTQSLGIRWATSGPFLSFHLGGGPGGLPHFVEHLAPGMEQVWKTLGHATFDEATKATLIEQAGQSYGNQSYDRLSEARDAAEVAVIKALGPIKSPSVKQIGAAHG